MTSVIVQKGAPTLKNDGKGHITMTYYPVANYPVELLSNHLLQAGSKSILLPSLVRGMCQPSYYSHNCFHFKSPLLVYGD